MGYWQLKEIMSTIKQEGKKDYSHPDMKILYNNRKEILSLLSELWKKWELKEKLGVFLNNLNLIIKKHQNDLFAEKSRWQISFSNKMPGLLKEKIIRAIPDEVRIEQRDEGEKLFLIVTQVKDNVSNFQKDPAYPDQPIERKIPIEYINNKEYPDSISWAIVE